MGACAPAAKLAAEMKQRANRKVNMSSRLSREVHHVR